MVTPTIFSFVSIFFKNPSGSLIPRVQKNNNSVVLQRFNSVLIRESFVGADEGPDL